MLQRIRLSFNVWLPVQTFVVFSYSSHCRTLFSHLDVTTTNVYILQSDTSPSPTRASTLTGALVGRTTEAWATGRVLITLLLPNATKQLSQGRSFPFKTLMIIDIHPPLDRIGTITQSVLASWHRLVPPPVLNEKIMQKCKFWCGPSFATFAQCLKPLSWWNAGLSPTFNILTDDFRFLWRIWTWFSFTV